MALVIAPCIRVPCWVHCSVFRGKPDLHSVNQVTLIKMNRLKQYICTTTPSALPSIVDALAWCNCSIHQQSTMVAPCSVVRGKPASLYKQVTDIYTKSCVNHVILIKMKRMKR